jgi:Gas vesicle synthesis protein GvpL/GvpF
MNTSRSNQETFTLIGIAKAIPDMHCEAGFVAVSASGLMAVLARLNSEAAADAIAHHHAVIEQARLGPFLPARFGAFMGDEASLKRHLAEEALGLKAALQRLEGRVEVLFAIRHPGAGTPAPSARPRPVSGSISGSAYLRERQRAQAQEVARARDLETLKGDIDAGLEGLADDFRILPAQQDQIVLAGAILARRPAATAAAAHLRACLDARPDSGCTLDMVGPLPPYTFATKWLPA